MKSSRPIIVWSCRLLLPPDIGRTVLSQMELGRGTKAARGPFGLSIVQSIDR